MSPDTEARILMELTDLKRQITDLADTIHSRGDHPGIAEELRAVKERVSFLENLVKWLAGVGTAVLTAALIAVLALSRLAH